jgi:hypothetical protein
MRGVQYLAMKAQGKRQKGKRLEKKFSDMLVHAEIDEFAKPQLMSGAVKGWDGDIKTNAPIHVECKNTESWEPLKAYEQAKNSNPNPGRLINVVVMDKNRLDDPMVMVKAQDFVNLLYFALKGGYE